jgi:hypothetical protein
MKEKKLIKDIYRLLDGELSPEERDELERYIAQNPEAARLFNQCNIAKKQLESLPEIEVDPEIKAGILDRVYAQQPSPQNKVTTGSYIQEAWQRPVFKFGFVFVAGLFLGFFVFSYFKTDMFQAARDTEKMKGTLTSPRSFEELKVADILTFENQQVKAVCNARYSPEFVEIHLDLTADQMITSILEFEINDFSLYNIQPLQVNHQSTTLVASNSLNINAIGSNTYKILLYNKKTHTQEIGFRLVQNGQEIYRNSITVNQ